MKEKEENDNSRCLQEKKKELGISIAEIAQRCGIPEKTVSYFFTRNSKAASLHTAASICKVLGVSLDEHFGIKPNEFTEQKILLISLARQFLAVLDA